MVSNPAVVRGKMGFARWYWQGAKEKRPHRQSRSCIIFGNGPSLADIDPFDVKDSFRLHVNDYLPWSMATGLVPDILVMQDRHAFATYPDAISMALSAGARVYVPLSTAGNLRWVNLRKRQLGFFAFSDRSSEEAELDVPGLTIAANYTVTATAIEIASYLGFTRIALLGCDNRYVIPPDATTESDPESGAPTYRLPPGRTDPNHFGSPVFKNDALAYFPKIEFHEESYRIAAERARARGATVVNCSTRGSIDSLPALPLAEFLALNG